MVSWGYLAAFAVALGLSVLGTPVALRVAMRTGVLDRPGAHKGHAAPVPYLGGVAIMAAFCAALLIAARFGSGRLGVVLLLGLAIGAVGLLDDVRGLGSGVRLTAQIAAATALWALGSRVAVTGSAGFDAALTVIWVVGVTNAFNLLDNMDGLSAGIATVAALWFAMLAAVGGQDLVATAAFALAGSALGFLGWNRHPARIYMGDAGSLFLGFVLAVLAIELHGPGGGAAPAVPVLVLGVAIFDTSLVTVTRLAHGSSPFHGGRDHISHRLVRLGLGVRGAVGLLCASGFVLGVLGAVASRLGGTAGLALAGVVVAAAVVLAARLAAVPITDARPARAEVTVAAGARGARGQERRMRVVVTGGAGFIGANAVRALLSSDAVAEVVVVDDLSTGRRANLDGLAGVRLLRGSVLDEALLDHALARADAVVHLAARPSVARSLENPSASHEVNATGTLCVLEAARRAGGLHTVVASSSSVYGDTPVLPKHEGLPAAPRSPYAASKLATEAYTLSYAASFGMPVLALRLFNVFGPLQPAGHAYAACIPAFVAAALEGRPLQVHGDGCQTRDFTCVSSVADVLVAAVIRRVTSARPVNLAFGSRRSLLDVIATLEEILGRPLAISHEAPRPGDVRDSQADHRVLDELFGEVRPVPFAEGLRSTVAWARSQPLREAVDLTVVG